MKTLLLLSVVTLPLLSCKALKTTFGKTKKIDWQGHRGCRGLLPENTIPAMLKAIDLGVNTLEMDVVITADQQVLVSHEPYFSHEITTLQSGEFVSKENELKFNIYRMNYSEVSIFDVGQKSHPRFPEQKKVPASKPTLIDVFRATKHNKTLQYNIEIKTNPATDDLFHPKPGEFVDLLMKVIKDEKVERRTTLQSFDKRPLQYLNKKFPAIALAFLIEGETIKPIKDIIKELRFIPTTVSPHYSLVNRQVVEQCHLYNIKIIPWTVNEKKKIKALIRMGVDGIITDYPNLIQR